MSLQFAASTVLLVSRGFFFLSEAVDVDALTVTQDLGDTTHDRPVRGYPTSGILDATVEWWDTTEDDVTPDPFCWDPVYPGYERLPGPDLTGSDDLRSAARKAFPLLDGSGTVLLDTNTSRVDRVPALRTPGWIPGG